MNQTLTAGAALVCLSLVALRPSALRMTARLHDALQTPLRRAIVLCLLAAGNTGLRVTDVSRRTGIPLYQVSRQLTKLNRALLATLLPAEGRAKRFRASPLAQDWLRAAGLGRAGKALEDCLAALASPRRAPAALQLNTLIHEALANKTRLGILSLLALQAPRGMRSGDLARELRISPALARNHLRKLETCQLVRNELRRQGANPGDHDRAIQSWYFLAGAARKWLDLMPGPAAHGPPQASAAFVLRPETMAASG